MTPRTFTTRMVVFVFTVLFLLVTASVASGTAAKVLVLGSGETSEATSENPSVSAADTIVISLSDEQVARLAEVLDGPELSAESQQKEESGGLVRIVESIRKKADMVENRVGLLQSGDGPEKRQMPKFVRLLAGERGGKKADPASTIMSVIALFGASLLIFWVYRRFARRWYRRLESIDDLNLRSRLGALGLRSALDLSAILIFILSVLIIFFIFFEDNAAQRILAATYLIGFMVVMFVHLLCRFFLAPRAVHLRFLPLEDGTATYLQRWIMAIAIVGSFGLLTCGIYRLAGSSELLHLSMMSAVSLTITLMFITMILQNRSTIRSTIEKDLPDVGFRSVLARTWHYLAIAGVLMLWGLTALNQFLGGVRPGMPGIQSLIIIPLYFLLDWSLREILGVLFGIAARPSSITVSWGEADNRSNSAAEEVGPEPLSGDSIQDETQENDSLSPEMAVINKHVDMKRINHVISGGLRIALGAAFLFYLLNIWGIDIRFGKAVTKAVFNILVAVLICYVAWEWISAVIERRLALEMPEEDEDREEGGAGGSRIGTLLMLLRKFMLIVMIVMSSLIILSSIGVNIGPLIAGAGVIGLAIGFGAQTLVKDIIAGVFFLVDDAFRVGDYVEAAGSKGMVEHISIRSLRLRHPRGMVNTIPFGDMGIVTNFSRDYIITKLDFRVKYDTDVEKVRKIIKKKVYKKILKNEDLGPKLLGKIKSQGVRELDDSAMLMRVKFKTIPGEQFAIRKEVFRLMQESFRDEGIEFAHKNVTVYLPPEQSGNGAPVMEQAIKAAGAAVLAEGKEKIPEDKK